MLTSDELPENPDEPWVGVGFHDSVGEALDHALVVLAMGGACRVVDAGDGRYLLEVEPHAEAKAHEELEAYRREALEARNKPAAFTEWKVYPAGGWLTALWMIALIAVFFWQSEDPAISDKGASSSIGLIEQGEWWRPFTALFLHADVPHLMGNLAGGAVFGTLVAKFLGPVRAWSLILVCGALGNALTSFITYPERFLSLGASTAVFAALGILSGTGMVETLVERSRLPWLRVFAPFLGGLVLLGWLGGATDGNTDVLGHVMGFASGVCGGAMAGWMLSRSTCSHRIHLAR